MYKNTGNGWQKYDTSTTPPSSSSSSQPRSSSTTSSTPQQQRSTGSWQSAGGDTSWADPGSKRARRARTDSIASARTKLARQVVRAKAAWAAERIVWEVASAVAVGRIGLVLGEVPGTSPAVAVGLGDGDSRVKKVSGFRFLLLAGSDEEIAPRHPSLDPGLIL